MRFLAIALLCALPAFAALEDKELAACLKGKRKVDLSWEFNPPKQQVNGSCYAFGSAAGIEAALMRKVRKHFVISEKLALASYFAQAPLKDIDSRICDAHCEIRAGRATAFINGGNLLKFNTSLLHSPEIFLETTPASPVEGLGAFSDSLDNRALHECNSKGTQATAQNELALARQAHTAVVPAELQKQLVLQNNFTTDATPSDSTNAMNQLSFANALARFEPLVIEFGHAWTAAQAGQKFVFNQNKSQITKFVDDNFNFIKNFAHSQDMSSQQLIDQLTIYENAMNYFKLADPKDSVAITVRALTECDRASKSVQRLIMEHLCRDIPLDAGFLNSGHDIFSVTTADWQFRSGGDLHAGNIQGFENVDGAEYLIIRDSNAPNAILTRFRLSESCRFVDIETFLNEEDRFKLRDVPGVVIPKEAIELNDEDHKI